MMKLITTVIPVLVGLFTLSSQAGENIDKSLPINNATKVTIENLRGNVVIVGGAENNISVKGELDDKAEKFIFEQEGSQILIKVVMPRHLGHGSWNENGSDLTINLPAHMKVNFSGVSSNVKLSDIENDVDIQTVSGDIKATNLSNMVHLSSVSGNIRSEDLDGELHLSSVSGDIRDKQSSGRLSIKVVSGNVTTQSSASEVSLGTVSGEVYVQLAKVDELSVSMVSGDFDGVIHVADNGLVKMSSVSGDLRLKLNEDIQAKFKVFANAGGKLINKLSKDKAQEAEYGPSSKLYFVKGDGSSTVKLKTVSGDVTLSTK